MRYGKIFICLFTLLLAALGIVVCTAEERVAALPVSLSFAVDSGEQTESIECWENSQNMVYVFLPGYAELSDVYVQVEGNGTVLIDGQVVLNGMSCGAFQLDREYLLQVQSGKKSEEQCLVFVKSGQIPAMYIDVRSGSMEFIHMDKDNKEPGEMRLYDSNGRQLHHCKLDTVKGRGNTSWGAEKKPYNITLAQEESLLGMGAAQRWILLAESASDNVNIRNKIVYDFAEKAGLPYSPDNRWVDLYLNGEYAGLYLLSERNEVHENRVDIAGEGHFLVSLEFEYRLEEAGYPFVRTDSGQCLRIHSTEADGQELDVLWQAVENALLSEDGRDPVTGKHWKELIDMESWARKHILEEFFANGDGGSLSQFFFRYGDSADEKIYAGPVWDYDLALGGGNYWLTDYINYFVMDRGQKEDGYGTPWFQALYRKDEFRALVEDLYEREFLPLIQQLSQQELDGYVQMAEGSYYTNALRWEMSVDAIQWDIDYIRRFLTERTKFLTDVWLNHMEYHTVRVDTGRAAMYGYFAVKPGECLPELPSYERINGIGWFVEGTDEPFDVTQPIYEDVQIYVKVQEFQIPKYHYLPFAVLIVAVPGLAAVSGYQNRKNRRSGHDAADV